MLKTCVKIYNLSVVSVRDEDISASIPSPTTRRCERKLILPREELLVIFDEPIIVVGDRIRGVNIN